MAARSIGPRSSRLPASSSATSAVGATRVGGERRVELGGAVGHLAAVERHAVEVGEAEDGRHARRVERAIADEARLRFEAGIDWRDGGAGRVRVGKVDADQAADRVAGVAHAVATGATGCKHERQRDGAEAPHRRLHYNGRSSPVSSSQPRRLCASITVRCLDLWENRGLRKRSSPSCVGSSCAASTQSATSCHPSASWPRSSGSTARRCARRSSRSSTWGSSRPARATARACSTSCRPPAWSWCRT